MRPFLTAEWRSLVILNYRVDDELLRERVPAGTELDRWDGSAFVSVVGFLFRNVAIRGIPVPFHRHFEEVNLRFYVRRRVAGEWRRGVVFIREIVPKRLVAAVARGLYHEPYVTRPMRYHVVAPGVGSESGSVAYSWRVDGRWQRVGASISGPPLPLADGSVEEFITEHYWGYTALPDGSTREYRVDHPPWRVWSAGDPYFACDLEKVYGPELAVPLRSVPHSALVAEGSPVSVYPGVGLLDDPVQRQGHE
ncbi:MAG: DUF2071 domain-containing protein [Gemmatimonadota bacterium]|nr:DUF2071 domain-containing protein [Gemmatimonadota bacterium]